MMSTTVRRVATVTMVVAMVAVGCSSTDDGASTTSTTRAPRTAPVPAAKVLDSVAAASLSAEIAAHPGCDPLDATSCLLPFPSNVFTKPDPSSSTRVRIDLPTGLLANTSGATLDPTEWNRNDGFSPGTPMLVNLPGVDLEKSGAALQGDIGASVSTRSATVVLDMTTGKRLPHWAELDAKPGNHEPLTILHPAAALPEGHHIAVGFVDMRTSSGDAVPASAAFMAYRDNRTFTDAAFEARRPAMEQVFAALATAGVDRSKLTVAWDFTVASADNLAGRMLHIRDDAFAALGDRPPTFTVDEVITDPAKLHDGIARLVRGTLSVPSYLAGDGGPGSRFNDGPDGLPSTDRPITVDYSCQVPRKAVDAAGSARPVVYGHGLLGSREEVEGSQAAHIAMTNDMLYCATDWIGFSEADAGYAVAALSDISKFPAVVDRSQQGFLDFMFLARVMKHPSGFGANPAFQTAAGQSVIDGTEAYYDGNSQGGIMGGAVTAVSTEWTKAVLGVPGMDYSILLGRSVDFNQYFVFLNKAYPDRIDQQLIYGILQMLWDRAEADGYAQHLTGHPYPKTPRHQVQLHVAFGDHQVAPVTAEMEARTIGANVHLPALAAGRHPDAKPLWGLTAPKAYPYSGSILEYWDSGTLAPPMGNVTPVESDQWKQTCGTLTKAQIEHDARCNDPHEDPRRQIGTTRAKDAFFRPDGKVIDPCDGKACAATPAFDLQW